MLGCYLARRRLGAWLDGALDEPRAGRTAAHVAGCARCQAEAEGWRRLRAAVAASLPAPAPPDWTGFWPGILRGIEAGAGQPARPPARSRAATWIRTRPRLAFGGALAAALLLSAGLWQVLDAPVGPGAPPVVVRSANTEHPGATLMVYAPPEQDMAVVWVFGLDQ